MSTHRVQRVTRYPFHKERYAINGKVPPATSFRRLNDAMNHVVGYAKKQWTTRAVNLDNVVTPSSATTYCFQTYMHTGEGTDTLWVYLGLVKTDYTVVYGSPPTMQVDAVAYDNSSTYASADYTFNQTSSAGAIVPDDIHHTLVKLEDIPSNTAMKIIFKPDGGARAVYVMIVEGRQSVVSTATTGVCDPGSARVEGDIDDASIAKLVDANNKLWRHNGAPILCWTCDYEMTTAGAGVPVINGNTSYTDVYTNRGFTLDTRYRTTLMRTSFPCVMAVRSDRTGGTGTLDVRLYDGTNSIAVTGIGDDGTTTTFTTATGSLPTALTSTWRLQAKQSDAVTTHRLYAVMVYPYET